MFFVFNFQSSMGQYGVLLHPPVLTPDGTQGANLKIPKVVYAPHSEMSPLSPSLDVTSMPSGYRSF